MITLKKGERLVVVGIHPATGMPVVLLDKKVKEDMELKSVTVFGKELKLGGD